MGREFEGSNYTPGMTIKDVATAMRKYTKTKYPDCKFSITTKSFSGGSSISLALLGAPYAAFVESDRFTNYDVNYYYIERNSVLTAPIKKILQDVISELRSYNYDNSDSMIDYFDTNFYMNIRVGKWDRPYVITESKCPQVMKEIPCPAGEEAERQGEDIQPLETEEFDEDNCEIGMGM